MDGKRKIQIVNIPGRILDVLREKHGKANGKAGAGTWEQGRLSFCLEASSSLNPTPHQKLSPLPQLPPFTAFL
jgi:hypothetical protein